MDTIKSTTGYDVDRFEPTRFRLVQAALDYGIAEAKRIRDWPALERAVDDKIAEQKKFLAWWKASVQRPGGDHSPGTRLMPCTQAERLTGLRQQRVSDLGQRLKDPDAYRQRLLGATYREAMLEAEPNRCLGSLGHELRRSPLASLGAISRETSVEWFTPAKYVAMARTVMGNIDLDPASCELANHTVKAKKFFSVADDGLKQDWFGRVWLNAPYGPDLRLFSQKLLREVEAGHIEQVIDLTCNSSDAAWFQNLAKKADLACFPQGRIQFIDQYGKKSGGISGGQVFFYFGKNITKFVEVFGPIGWIAVSYK